jgi:DNA-binding CsgD family transcriptional regulator
MEAFEVSNTPVVLINRHGNVFKANPSAEQLLVGEIQIKRGKLTASDLLATTKLHRAVHDLLGSSNAALSAPIPLPRKGRRPLIAYPARFSSMTSNALADCQALIVLIDPDAGSRPPEATLRSVFGLSEAEARLGVQLAQGEPLETVADRLGIAKETSRSQLKHIFSKIGVHRQAELVAVLARLLTNAGEHDIHGNPR